MSKEKWLVPEDKAKRIATAAIAAGVVVVLFLLVVMIVQFVRIGAARAENDRLQQSIDEYQESISDNREKLEFYESEIGLYHQALQNGWTTPKR